MLTVLDDFAAAMSYPVECGEKDIAFLFYLGYDHAQASLEKTPELLESLRKAGVVDAGAAGFVDLLAGIDRLLREGEMPPLPDVDYEVDMSDSASAGEVADLRYRYLHRMPAARHRARPAQVTRETRRAG